MTRQRNPAITEPAQTQPAPDPTAATRSRPLEILAYAGGLLTHAKTIALNLLVVAISAIIAWHAYLEIRTTAVIVNPVRVPEALARQGYSPEVVAHRLTFYLQEKQSIATTQKSRERLATTADKFDFQIPGAGLGYRSVVGFAKEAFGSTDNAITGDVTQSGETLEMRAVVRRANGDNNFLRVAGDSGIVELFLEDAAEAILKALDPYMLANYYQARARKQCESRGDDPANCDYSAAIRHYEDIVKSGPADARAWALLGRASIHQHRKEFAGQAKYAEEASTKDRKFALAYFSWGDALRNLERYPEAFEKYRLAARLDPPLAKNALWVWGYADILKNRERYPEAFENYRLAAKLDPVEYSAVVIEFCQDIVGFNAASAVNAVKIKPPAGCKKLLESH